MDKTSETWQNLQRFANEHKLILEDRGEVGFGRPCVGFLRGTSYVNYNPWADDLERRQPLGCDYNLCPPPDKVPDAYHKHDCLAVLVYGDGYDKALEQLNEWVKHLEAQGPVEVVEYRTGAQGLQAIFSGFIGYAIRFKKDGE